MLPNFFFEKKLWRKGYRVIAGVDEVGRGSFAGPVVAAAVAFRQTLNSKFEIPNNFKINDSKRLSPKQRKTADRWIRKNAMAFGIGEASVGQINRLGIKKATEIAFRKAISKVKPDYLLIDAFFIPYVRGLRRKNQKAIIKGDTKSISIAAASIVAKVYRDKLMEKLGSVRKFKKYGWAQNKGYGTKKHQKAIKKYGSTKLNRKLYVESWLRNSSSSQSQ